MKDAIALNDAISLLVYPLLFAFVFWLFYRKGKTKKPSAPPETLTATLHALSQKIETFANKTIHPREYLDSPDFRKAVELLSQKDVSIDTLRQYATMGNSYIASAALEACCKHPDRQTLFNTIMLGFQNLTIQEMHYGLRYFASLGSRPPVGGPVVLARDWWSGNASVVESFREYFDARQKLGDAPEFGAYLDWSMCSSPVLILNLLHRVEHSFSATLREIVNRWSAMRVDKQFLNSFGRFWDDKKREDHLVVPSPWKQILDLAEKSVTAVPPRSILITGEARIGKTSILKLLGDRLAASGWRVFQASAAEIMAGQIYFGELEGRVQKVVNELDSGKRVAWFIGDINQMAESGTHRGQSASVLEQILPAVIAGRLVILAEASPDGMSRLFQSRPSLRAQIDVHRLQPFTNAELLELARGLGDLLAVENMILIDEEAIQTAMQLSQQYLGAGNLPGTIVDLLKRAFQHAKAAGENTVTPESMMAALSQFTGLPTAILDDKERVDLAAVRKFFTDRIMGQDEAVSAVVDRIAMLKAGLTDPGRPVAVFLFAGPTGTGKTELAKALATYLFASPSRMARVDMSELQTADATIKILGERGYIASESLVEKIRKQPFSVILLDEFEKAHPNVWDLCLQIFDDGRLTDANGRTVDFRHTIIILTSNLGATEHRGGGIGFTAVKDAYGESQVLKAVARTFRPEFINRLDKIVVFKSLSRELMRQILHKELRLVLERRGLRNREWVVEWEPSAVDFLLDKGFSPEMGARPLKRAIDQYLLAPLASTLVEHRFPEGDQFLFVRSNGREIEVEFVDPYADLHAQEAEPEADTAPPIGVSLPEMIVQPQGAQAERSALDRHFAELSAQITSPAWEARKDKAQSEAGAPDIWSDPNRHAVFARVALIDRVDEALRTAERLKQRLDSGRTRAGRPSRELIARLALQLHLIGQGITDVLAQAPIDAVIAIDSVLESGGTKAASAEWCKRLSNMYRQWAERRHMLFEQFAPDDDANGPTILHVTGFGAFRTLSEEAGLHLMEETDAQSGRRLVARVRVAAGPDEDPRPDQAYRAYVGIIDRAEELTAVVRRYRENPAPLVRDAKAGWRSGKLDMVLAGDFDLMGTLQ